MKKKLLKTLFVSLIVIAHYAILVLFYNYKKDKEIEIIMVSSYNEMIPLEYTDDFRIIIKQGNVYTEYKFDEIFETTEVVSVYELN